MTKILYALLLIACLCALSSGSFASSSNRMNTLDERSSKTDMEPFTKFMECMNEGARDNGNFDFQSWMGKLSKCTGMSNTSNTS